MTDTLINGGLSTIYPQSVWISKERTSACISDNGIVSCVFHGNQAVSRNSYILKGTVDEPAFKFNFRKKDRIVSYKVKSCLYSISGCTMEIETEGYLLKIIIYILNNSIRINFISPDDFQNLTIDVILDKAKLAKKVYGNRKWSVKHKSKSLLTRLIADDRTKISEWFSKHGSFLIPIEIQNKIFIKDPLSDITFSDKEPEIKSEYKDELFIKAQIYTDICGFGFINSSSNKEDIVFSSDLSSNGNKQLIVQFSSIEGGSEKSEKTRADIICSAAELPKLTYPDARPLEELFSFIPGVFDL